ncbi:MAG: hypothetical protein HY658_11615 [Actinobacteria bacterium]|nr:hypothetical protein [Actinomycetota bacterium]
MEQRDCGAGAGRGPAVPSSGSRLAGEERGSVSSEYGLLLALIAIVIVGALALFGTAVVGLFDSGTAGVTGG